jgi:hypothetical protein
MGLVSTALSMAIATQDRGMKARIRAFQNGDKRSGDYWDSQDPHVSGPILLFSLPCRYTSIQYLLLHV